MSQTDSVSTPRRTRAETAQETADRLVAAATRAFAAQGFAAVSLDALAAEAGVTRGALHHHFGNRAGLFQAVLRRMVADIGAALDARWEADIAAGADPWTAFRSCSHAYLDAVLAPDRRRILFQDAPAALGELAWDIILSEGLGAMVDDLTRLVADGRVVAVDPLALGHALNGATVNLAHWASQGGAAEGRLARAHTTLAVMFDGLTGGEVRS
jgi:AcrR family transcriptional regulator